MLGQYIPEAHYLEATGSINEVISRIIQKVVAMLVMEEAAAHAREREHWPAHLRSTDARPWQDERPLRMMKRKENSGDRQHIYIKHCINEQSKHVRQ